MKKSFTPGPWRVYSFGQINGEQTYWVGHGESNSQGPSPIVDFVYPISPNNTDVKKYNGISEANARLIAAAPEMLDALEIIEKYMYSYDSDDQEDKKTYELVQTLIKKIRG